MLDQVEHRIHRRKVAVGTIIRRTGFDNLSSPENAWKVFILHADGRVGLVVLQQYIVAGLIFLDQIVFQQ